MEMKVWAQEAKQQGKTLKEAMVAYRRTTSTNKKEEQGDTASIAEPVPGLNGMELSFSDQATKVELEITR